MDAPGSPPRSTVLIVEDDVDFAEMVRFALEADGHRVVWRGDASGGLAAAAAHAPDVVVLDVALPDRHGGEVLRALRADPATCATPVIVLSGRAATLDWRGDGKVVGVFGKPCSVADLRKSVRHAVSSPE